MNDKQAKQLRHAAGYRNQSATPGVIPFPGVARLYSHPVMSRRPAIRTSYMRLPLDSHPTKVTTKKMSLVHGAGNKPVTEIEMRPVMEHTLDAEGKQVYDSNGRPATHPVMKDGQPVLRAAIKETLVPVSKPALLDPRCPKGVYRSLKRLAQRGLLTGDRLLALGTAAAQANKEAQ